MLSDKFLFKVSLVQAFVDLVWACSESSILFSILTVCVLPAKGETISERYFLQVFMFIFRLPLLVLFVEIDVF